MKHIYMYSNKAQHEQSKSAGHSAEHSMQEMLSSQSGSSINEKAITGVKSTDHGRRIINLFHFFWHTIRYWTI